MKKSFVIAGILSSLIVFTTMANGNQPTRESDSTYTQLTTLEEELSHELDQYYDSVFNTSLENITAPALMEVRVYDQSGQMVYFKEACCLSEVVLPQGATLLMKEGQTAYFLVQ